MSHRVETMMYTREQPWHGLGVALPEEVTAEDAIKFAGLDWEVTLEEVYVCGKLVKDKLATMRSTDLQTLGIVGNRYEPVQNRDAFKFFDKAVGKKGGAIYHTAGSLREGRNIWILAKLPDHYEVRKVDPVDNYILLTSSHDGSTQVTMLWTPTRVVCWNTLNIALRGTREKFQTRHTRNVMNRAMDAAEILGLATSQFNNFMEEAEKIAAMAFKQAELDAFVYNLFELKEGVALDEQHKIKREAAERVAQLAEVGTGIADNKATKGTRWGLFNAVTEYVDHDRNVRAKAGRMENAWFGSGAYIKQRAWNLLTDPKTMEHEVVLPSVN